MSDMSAAIIPKSDQLNSDDLIAGPMTITITDVTIRSGQEQPVSIHFTGDNGKPYKSCKSMNRVLVTAWGADAKKYVGRSMTLYRDPTVKWAGMEVGGIRISHMSDIDGSLTMALTATKGSRKPFTVKPLAKVSAPPPAEQSAPPPSQTSAEGAAEFITRDQCAAIETRLQDAMIQPANFKKAANVERIAQVLAADYDKANDWISRAIAKRSTQKA